MAPPSDLPLIIHPPPPSIQNYLVSITLSLHPDGSISPLIQHCVIDSKPLRNKIKKLNKRTQSINNKKSIPSSSIQPTPASISSSISDNQLTPSQSKSHTWYVPSRNNINYKNFTLAAYLKLIKRLPSSSHAEPILKFLQAWYYFLDYLDSTGCHDLDVQSEVFNKKNASFRNTNVSYREFITRVQRLHYNNLLLDFILPVIPLTRCTHQPVDDHLDCRCTIHILETNDTNEFYYYVIPESTNPDFSLPHEPGGNVVIPPNPMNSSSFF
jgi:hypothetical protein